MRVLSCSKKIDIVEYHPGLAAKVADMWNKSYEGWGGERSIYTEERVRVQEENSTNLHLYIAFDGDQAVGYCGLSEYRDDHGALYIPLLNVRDDYHGKKVGKALVLKVLQRAIEMNWPRLDLYTWPGNTKAVPLYKKCGFFWEDRDDTVHLMNFMPTVLNTEAFSEFFKKINWYDCSSRGIEVKPDGLKQNGFDYFEYSWKHEEQSLKIQFEKTGRGIRYIETEEYCIYASINQPSLVFGNSYPITYNIINKTATPLSIQLNGVNDKNIAFSFNQEVVVTDHTELTGTFFVGEIKEEQNNFRTHPTVTTVIKINNKKVVFKTGIMPKYPLKLSAKLPLEQCFINKQQFIFLELENNFEEEASFSLQLPTKDFISFKEEVIKVTMIPNERKLIEVPYSLHSFGFYQEEVVINWELKDGKKKAFKKKLGIPFPGIGCSIAGECDEYWHMYLGLNHVTLSKTFNSIGFGKGTKKTNGISILHPKLGKPFSEEFSIQSPTVTFQTEHGYMLMRATYQSRDFQGVYLHCCLKFYPEGLLEHFFEIENKDGQNYDSIFIYDPMVYEFSNAIFSYKNELIKLSGSYAGKFNDWDSIHISENWFFSNGRGLNWDKEMKLFFANWCLYFEHCIPSLKQGSIATTRSKFLNVGVFKTWEEQRSFALQAAYQKTETTYDHLQLTTADGNPFVTNNTSIKLINRKNTFLDGAVTLTKDNSNFSQEQSLSYDEEKQELNFDNVSVEKNKIQTIIASGNLNGLVLDLKTIVINKGKQSVVKTKHEEDSGRIQYIVNNGLIEFACDPNFYPGIYSLKEKGIEWLDSSYPTLCARAWWNPWSGGVRTGFENFRPESVLKEHRTAEFVSTVDQYKNVWEGIKVTVNVSLHEEYKGLIYHQYFLTLPESPVLCYFIEFEQNTNKYFHFLQNTHSISLNTKQGNAITFTNQGSEQMFEVGSEEIHLSDLKGISFQQLGGESTLQIVAQVDYEDIELYTNKQITNVSITKKIHAVTNTLTRTPPNFFLFSSSTIDDQALKGLNSLIFKGD